MKITKNINIAGLPFIIDEDAYLLLEEYLDTIQKAFPKEDDKELMADIEARIAEILLENNPSPGRIVTIDEIQKIIHQIGNAEEIFVDLEDNEIIEGNNPEERIEETISINPPPYVPPIKKKLFRDPQNAILGGVCSGLAWYVNMDPTVMRLLTVLLTLLSVTTCGIAYLILWIVIPEARTPYQRMEMMGKSPTMENIAKTVTGEFDDSRENSNGDYTSRSNFWTFIANICGIFAKILVILLGVIGGIFIFITLILVVFSFIFLVGLTPVEFMNPQMLEMVNKWGDTFKLLSGMGLITGFGIILTIAIPLFLLAKKILYPQSKSYSNKSLFYLWFIWIIGLASFIVAGIISLNVYQNFKEKNFLKHIPEETAYEITIEKPDEENSTSITIQKNKNKTGSSIEVIKKNSSPILNDTINQIITVETASPEADMEITDTITSSK